MSNKRKAPFPLEKVTINIREGDADSLSEWFPASGYSVVIRDIVRAYVDRTRAKLAANPAEAVVEPEREVVT